MMEKAKQLFKINLVLSIGMIIFIACEFYVINFTDGGSAGLNGSIWFSNMVLLVAFVFGCRGYINGRHVNKQLANAGLVMALGALVGFKMLGFSHVWLYGEMTYTLSGALMLLAAVMMFMNWSKTKKPAVEKAETKSDDKAVEVETAAEVKEDAEKSSEDDKKPEAKKADSDENKKDTEPEKSDSGDKEESSDDEKKKVSEKGSDDKTSEDNKAETSDDKDSSDKKSENSKDEKSPDDEKKDSDDKEPWIF